jgi:exonuclease III
VGDFKIPPSSIDRSSRQKNQQTNSRVEYTIDLTDLTDIYRVFYSATAQYTFFSAAHATFSKIDHILGHKASLNKYKKTELTPYCLTTTQ